MAKLAKYIQTQKINKKALNDLLNKLTFIEAWNAKDVHLEGLELSIDMSSKTKLPYVKIEKDEPDFSLIEELEINIKAAIEFASFECLDSEERFGAYFIHFK